MLKQKTILLKGDKKAEFVKLIASRFGVYAESELNLLICLVNHGLFAPFNMNKYMRSHLSHLSGIKDNTISQSVKRLVARGAIKKDSKTYYLNYAFSNLDDFDQITFKYSPE